MVRKPSFPCPWDLRNRLFFWGSSLCCSLDLLLTVLFGKLLDEQKKLCHKRKVSAGPPKKPGVRVVSCHLLYDICTILSLIVLSKNYSKNKTKKKKSTNPSSPSTKNSPHVKTDRKTARDFFLQVQQDLLSSENNWQINHVWLYSSPESLLEAERWRLTTKMSNSEH